MATVELKVVRKSYGSVEVIHGVSFDIRDGEFLIMVGPSGCGKSTLLRMIAGLEGITGGEVTLDDQVINAVPAKKRDMAMVFQNYALYPHMTVAENMGFSLKLAGRPKAERRRRVEEAARILGLEPYLDRHPRQLSGGQRQRVAMGRAIVRDPKVFLFDEPLSNLDAKLRVQMRAEIKGLHQRLKTTTIYVTHDQVEAMTMADRIVVMNGGNVEQIGTPLELYDNPANTFVAGFIGSPSMNLIEGTATAEGFQDDAGTRWPIPGGLGVETGRRIVFGVRPEDLAPGPEGVPLEVSLTEPTGAEVQISGHVGQTPLVCVLRERVAAGPGDTLRIVPRRFHLFDRDSGRMLAPKAAAAA
ncbi:ABC transporter ATP-binding protein [Wenxinia marina]|uniref:Carbohydrate ABC transporter ATP-binding protein, CUT1 family n=1 Tax=Wenxinia marina DSM 24838 TaxID=1123501 RepID=A0A0D0QAV6_9RHOB|nr:sn-glycerol-3-phosphate ABC transporter ATP-binding protein UgpC [Wenxinia marina]KIQ68078.1 carbohydrate ABC transporter ATP-binding protein, CUT1 family [Wenxinia marina DSM 24838]GGL78029.1 ABC transporter ATP-binding protein [Wenxinia marina]